MFNLISKRFTFFISFFISMALASVEVNANPVTTTFLVTVNVLTACLVAATPQAFGNYDHTSATPLDAVSQITVTCTTGTPYNIGLDAGTGSGATVTVRKMTSGADTINYSLYQDAARTVVWGDTIGTNTKPFTASSTFDNHNVYGRMPAGQDGPPASAYSDTITVTVTY